VASPGFRPVVRGLTARGMHEAGRPSSWHLVPVMPAPDTAAAHMRDDLWLEVDGRVQWFGRSSLSEIIEED
jgi:hypothetical protein